ncbi:MAG: SCO1664 family protein [bacterium]|nr:SCO1664 family protein [bacterium]
MLDRRFPPESRHFFVADHRTHTTAELSKLIRHGRILECGLIPWGSNYTFLVSMDVGESAPLLGVYKPRRGETPLWDFPDGTLHKREYASFLLSEALGWQLVPPTVIREGPNGTGSVQLYIHHREEDADYFALRQEYVGEVQRMAVFDMVANNTDRKAGHCLKGEDGHIWGIDHGLTFHPHPKLRTVIWDFGGEPIPADLLTDIRRVYTELKTQQKMARKLNGVLMQAEMEALSDRLQDILQHPEFPCLQRRRNVPWSFY